MIPPWALRVARFEGPSQTLIQRRDHQLKKVPVVRVVRPDVAAISAGLPAETSGLLTVMSKSVQTSTGRKTRCVIRLASGDRGAMAAILRAGS